eukprot:9392752-Karenia_brevis.AAC.1
MSSDWEEEPDEEQRYQAEQHKLLKEESEKHNWPSKEWEDDKGWRNNKWNKKWGKKDWKKEEWNKDKWGPKNWGKKKMKAKAQAKVMDGTPLIPVENGGKNRGAGE